MMIMEIKPITELTEDELMLLTREGILRATLAEALYVRAELATLNANRAEQVMLNANRAKERKLEFLRLANGDIEIAKQFWKKLEIADWPED